MKKEISESWYYKILILAGYKIGSKYVLSFIWYLSLYNISLFRYWLLLTRTKMLKKCPHIKEEWPHFSWSISKNNTLRISFNEPFCVWCGWVWKFLYHKILFLIYLSLHYSQCINITSLLLLLGCFWYSLCMYSMYISLIMCIGDIDVWLHAQ